MQQLLWIETLLKLSGGLVLVLAPLTAIKVLGLPAAETGFWPRLLGAVLIGLGAAVFLEGRFGGLSRGLGIAGCLLVNMIAVTVIVSQLVLMKSPPTRRGPIILWLLVTLLLLLVAFEIAHI